MSAFVCVLSQMEPSTSFTEEELEKLILRIQDAGTEVVKAKDGAVSQPHKASSWP